MRLYDLFTEEELNAQIEAKMVKATPHPTADLVIYNYTQMAQFTPELWNHVTDKCRGLIATGDGELVARGFEKFWNLNDARHPETLMENLPATKPTLTRKMDGSLGILYRVDGAPAIATRGSFSSEQALWATAWLRRCSWANADFGPGTTPLRVKIKYATYCRLHKLLTQTNAVTVWEMLRDGIEVQALTEDVPAEFRAWIDSVEARLRGEFKAIENAALVAMLEYPGEKNILDKDTKKAFALYVIEKHKDVAPIMFAMVEGKKYEPIIWKQLRPRGDEKTFKVDEA